MNLTTEQVAKIKNLDERIKNGKKDQKNLAQAINLRALEIKESTEAYNILLAQNFREKSKLHIQQLKQQLSKKLGKMGGLLLLITSGIAFIFSTFFALLNQATIASSFLSFFLAFLVTNGFIILPYILKEVKNFYANIPLPLAAIRAIWEQKDIQELKKQLEEKERQKQALEQAWEVGCEKLTTLEEDKLLIKQILMAQTAEFQENYERNYTSLITDSPVLKRKKKGDGLN